MEIQFLNCKLIKLRAEHLEMVRNWRNSKEVSEFMINRNHITAEQQQQWFQSINNHTNFYFILEFDGVPIGLSDLKNIDWEQRNADSGIFIGLPEYRQTYVPMFNSVIIAFFIVYVLGIKNMYGYVLASNKDAIAFNKYNRFKEVERHGDVIRMGLLNIKKEDMPIQRFLRAKLCEVYKAPAESPVTLSITTAELNTDPAVKWLYDNIVLPQFPDFETDKPFVIA